MTQKWPYFVTSLPNYVKLSKYIWIFDIKIFRNTQVEKPRKKLKKPPKKANSLVKYGVKWPKNGPKMVSFWQYVNKLY